jgi:8-oxo-dGTP diphosphatase
MKQTTLALLIEDGHILLGLKKNGFGRGKYCGLGGKVEPGETIPAAAVREIREESGLEVEIENLLPRGAITFYFPQRPEWDLQTRLFMVSKWRGRPVETGEMQPAWFKTNKLPYDQMWEDARDWLPPVLAGNCIEASFTYGADLQSVVAKTIVLR